MRIFKFYSLILISIFIFQSCANFKPGDAKKSPPDPRERVKKNLEEGKGFRLGKLDTKKLRGGGSFEFATSNVLWRATLDIIDFMPLTSANYSGGVIITDWYSNDNNPNETIKITVRFLSNEIRSDAVNVKVFYKKCTADFKCIVSQNIGNLKTELQKEILKKATIYKDEDKAKNFKPYLSSPKVGKGD
ncbi:DUF3576 domain-containing protein [Candidatus Pelagibacter sp.]|nr:DUF3576 domain-containing protein [Candidatus Pelagibacter sp.]